MHSDRLLPIQVQVGDGREAQGVARIEPFLVEASCGLPATELRSAFGMHDVSPNRVCDRRRREFLCPYQHERGLARSRWLRWVAVRMRPEQHLQ